jgi:hypothetical protein
MTEVSARHNFVTAGLGLYLASDLASVIPEERGNHQNYPATYPRDPALGQILPNFLLS